MTGLFRLCRQELIKIVLRKMIHERYDNVPVEQKALSFVAVLDIGKLLL